MSFTIPSIGHCLKEAFRFIYKKTKATFKGCLLYIITDTKSKEVAQTVLGNNQNKQSIPNDLYYKKMINSLKKEDVTSASKIIIKHKLTTSKTSKLLTKLNILPKKEAKKSKEILYKNLFKNIGHNWGLEGDLKIGNTKFRLEGNYLEIAQANLATSVKNYFGENSSEHEKLSPHQKQMITHSLENSLKYTYNIGNAAEALKEYKSGQPVTFGTGWQGHGVEITLHNGFLVYTNRSSKKMQIFTIGKQLTESQLKKMMISLGTQGDVKGRKNWFENGGMQKDLGLSLFKNVEKSKTKVGNCTWANAKGGFHAELLLIKMQEYENKGLSLERAYKIAAVESKAIFKDWQWYHKTKDAESLLSLKEDMKNTNSPLDKKTYEFIKNQMVQKLFSKKNVPIEHKLKIKALLRTA